MQERSDNIQIAEPVDNAAHKEPLVKVYVMNVENLINSENQTEIPKEDGAVLKRAETAAPIAFHGMFPSRKHVDLSKPTSENNSRTSTADVKDPKKGSAMKKLQHDDDNETRTQP